MVQSLLPPEPITTRQTISQMESTAVVLIGNSKRVGVDNTARRLGKSSATKALPLLMESYQRQKSVFRLGDKGLILHRKEWRA